MLLITLSFILLLTVIAVAFLVRSRSSLQTSQSYTKEIVAQEIGEIAIDKIAAEFQAEINFARTNGGRQMLLPPRIGITNSNPRELTLIRRTVGDEGAYKAGYAEAGFGSPPHGNDASKISTATTAKNGWRFDPIRWLAPGLLSDDQTNSIVGAPPDWVYVYRTRTTNASDIIGRYAAAVYDVSGLLDINEVGVPSDLLGDKGSVAFADLSAIDSIDPTKANLAAELPSWRYGGSLPGDSELVSDFYGLTQPDDYSSPEKFLEAINPKTAGLLESPKAKMDAWKNRFFSRMELVELANNPNNKQGLTPSLLPYLRNRSESANRISVENLFADGTSAATNYTDLKASRNIEFKFNYSYTDQETGTTKQKEVSVVRVGLDDTASAPSIKTEPPYTIKTGQPLFRDRFPLARLRWLAYRNADGSPKVDPAIGRTYEFEIKKYFGLTWNSGSGMYIYTSPEGTGSTAATGIKTLKQLADGINSPNGLSPREPDFFEWLKAAIDPKSLGQTGGSTDREYPDPSSGVLTGTLSVPWEISKDLHILRIGANIIDQSDPDSIPTGIRSAFFDYNNNGTVSSPVDDFDSFGQENLPYLNEAITTAYRPGGGSKLNGYLQFELWNPNKEAYANSRIPKGYDGKNIKGVRIGTTKGKVLMEPYVYIPTSYAYPRTPNTGYETGIPTWSCYKNIAEYSRGEGFLSNPVADAITYNSPDLVNQFISVPYSSGQFFSEPFLASINGQDSSTPANSGEGNSLGTGERLYLGGVPTEGVNGILLCEVDVPNIAFSGIPLSCTSNSTVDGFYPYGAADKEDQSKKATSTKSGIKCYNAVKFQAYTGGWFNGVQTSPLTLQIDVETESGSFPVNRYNNLAFNIYHQNQEEGRISGIISGKHNSQEEGTWSSNSTTVYFSDSAQVSLRKGYPMSDPRTERFGLSDQNQATPGQGIYPKAIAGGGFSGDGINSNMTCGTIAAVGQALSSGGWDGQSPPAWPAVGIVKGTSFAAAPMEWALFDPNISMSVPAYLARNEWITSPSNPGPADKSPSRGPKNHAYKDYDGVARPGDARWVDWTSHPALPLSTLPSEEDKKNVLAARPTILDRPFRNVAELGCVFRDVPWKSLDLFSADSADRRLLDIFSIEDSFISVGKINPNTASAEVFEALMRGASLDPSGSLSSSSTLTEQRDSVANKVAISLASLNPAADPIHNSANITTRISINSDAKPDGGFSPYKIQAENFARAVSSSLDTRNWQMLIDVVAQSGKISPQSTSLADENNVLQGFVVEGQKRFYVYLTLDRITGEIIDKYIEVVYE